MKKKYVKFYLFMYIILGEGVQISGTSSRLTQKRIAISQRSEYKKRGYHCSDIHTIKIPLPQPKKQRKAAKK